MDPVRAYSADEGVIIDNIYEPPLQYHFLKRPYQLEPASASSMPVTSYLDDNFNSLPEDAENPAYSLLTISIKQNTLYQPHPAFVKNAAGNYRYIFNTAEESKDYVVLQDFPEQGTRELVVDDFIYQIKRMGDTSNKSPLVGFMWDYIDGMKEFSDNVSAVQKTMDKDQWLDLRQYEMSGLSKIDDYTFSIRIKGKYPQFQYWLAMRFFAPIPWEADRFYYNPGFKDKNLILDSNPVGTGPFMMVSNKPKDEIVLAKNPNYRDDYYPTEGASGDRERGFLNDAGKRLPLVDKLVFRHEGSAVAKWSKFKQGYLDRAGEISTNIRASNFDQAFTVSGTGVELSDELKALNMTMDQEIRPSISYVAFNMLDPVVGGYTEDKRKLRQAISIVWNTQEQIDIFINGLGQVAQSPVPPGLFGYRGGEEGVNNYVSDWKNGRSKRKSVDYARQLLAEAGYPNGRNAKTGKPVILYYDTSERDDGPIADWRKKQLAKLGIQLEFRSTDFNRFKEKLRGGNTQMFNWGWLADYPDPENFLFLLDSRQGSKKCNCDGSNSSNYDNPEYDALYDRMKTLPNGPERQMIIDKMVEIVRRDAPWIWGYNTTEFYLGNEWVGNTKRHGISTSVLKYVNIDPALRQKLQIERNTPIVLPAVFVFIGFFALLVPGFRAYRRRQKLVIRT